MDKYAPFVAAAYGLSCFSLLVISWLVYRRWSKAQEDLLKSDQ